MAPKPTPNGNAAQAAEATISSNIPAVVGINFGNTYASIAVYTKEGLAECIANENGERQIACAIAFHGEEIYVGNQAMPQLVKNAHNTITGFRNLLGKKFSEIDQSTAASSALIIQHPTEADTPAYQVEILQPAPKPLPKPLPTSATNTPAASHAPTPRSEPVPSTRILTPQEATTMFLTSLLQSASDFLGKPILGAVITAPPSFTQTQKEALKKAAEDAGVRVLQLLDEASAVLATTTSPQWPHDGEDRTQLVVDVGASSLSLSVIALRAGLGYVLGSRTSTNVANIGGDALSSLLVNHFAKEFTKKTKTALPQPPSSKEDIRATTKLLLALEYTKRTLSASPAPASLSVESLHSGLDFTATIARLRFDLLAAPVYTAISSEIKSLLESISLDPYDIDEITYVGGTTCLPGLDSHLLSSVGFTEEIQTAFSNSTTGSGAIGDPTGVLSIGCALQAGLLLRVQEESSDLVQAFEQSEEVKTIARTIGILFPTAGDGAEGLGGTYIAAIPKHTPLPARRIHEVEVTLSGGEGDAADKFGFEVWEVEEGVKVEKAAPLKPESPQDEDDEEEEEEPEEIKTKTTTKLSFLGAVLGETKGAAVKDKTKKGAYTATLQLELTLGLDGVLLVVARDSKGEKVGELRVE
ncbi:Hsp70 protein-domain-containing protein [Mycena sanguinolenta]|nr:Hsp70 protein-domain-containing protein [Mycena sanguinolenta]